MAGGRAISKVLKSGFVSEEQVRSLNLPRSVQDEVALGQSGCRVGGRLLKRNSWAPMTHRDLLDRVEASLARRQLALARDDQGKTRKQFTLAADGAKMAVILPLASEIVKDVNFMLLIVNSFDKSMAVRIGYGNEIRVCSNGSIFAQHVLHRKHCPSTLGNDYGKLDEGLDEALGRFDFYTQAQSNFLGILQNTALTDIDAHDVVVRSFLPATEAIMVGEAVHVVEQWHNPRFEEFRPRTAFSLFNAFTDVYRRGSESRMGVSQRNGIAFAERSTRLTRLFRDQFAPNVSFAEDAEGFATVNDN